MKKYFAATEYRGRFCAKTNIMKFSLPTIKKQDKIILPNDEKQKTRAIINILVKRSIIYP